MIIAIIEVVNSAKYRSVLIDDILNFQKHIKHLEKKLLRFVRILGKLKNYLSQHKLFKLYYAWVQSHLIYRAHSLGKHISNLSLQINYTSKQSSTFR